MGNIPETPQKNSPKLLRSNQQQKQIGEEKQFPLFTTISFGYSVSIHFSSVNLHLLYNTMEMQWSQVLFLVAIADQLHIIKKT